MRDKLPAVRRRTNDSLRGERARTDRALAQQQEQVEVEVDDVVQNARASADESMRAARHRADTGRDTATPGEARRTLAAERNAEDAAIRTERAAADEGLRVQREASMRALLDLLPHEREETDRSLLTERAGSDSAIASRDDFLGVVSHDLRGLLSTIGMSASLLAEQAGGAEETLSSTRRIQRSVTRMNRLIEDLLDVVSIEAGRLAVVPAPADLAALVVEAGDACRASAGAAGIALEVDVPEAPLMGVFDPGRVLQVLANLLSNALKFTPRGGAVVVRAGRAGDEFQVRVSDTGPGIPPEKTSAIFERYWQVGTNDRRGLGLGLYIARSIVTAHHGRIWVEGARGGGSVFCFVLPVDARHAVAEPS